MGSANRLSLFMAVRLNDFEHECQENRFCGSGALQAPRWNALSSTRWQTSRGLAASYLRLRRIVGIVFGEATDAKQRPGFSPDPPHAAFFAGALCLRGDLAVVFCF